MTSLPPEPADDSLVAQAEKSCAELERKVSSNSIDLLQVGFRHSLLDGGDDDDDDEDEDDDEDDDDEEEEEQDMRI